LLWFSKDLQARTIARDDDFAKRAAFVAGSMGIW